MTYYQPNPACRCGRCSTRGLMGPAMLVTLGVLFLLANSTSFDFGRTWPVLLIVVGAVKVARYVMPPAEHVNPGNLPPYGWQPGAPSQPAAYNSPSTASAPIVTPPPAPIAGVLNSANPDNDEVRHG